MSVLLSTWPKGCQAAVIFMVDDLANIFIDKMYGDWGAKRHSSDGLYSFLKENIISEYPWVKFTFFLVTDRRSPQVYGGYDYVKPCDEPAFASFLKDIEAEGHEIAYHGTNHGIVESGQFVQEWDTFSSIEGAVAQISRGQELFERALGHVAYGGKYCGYSSGNFGHQSLEKTGFLWWFDAWDENVRLRPKGEWKGQLFYFPSNIDCSHYPYNVFGKVPFVKYVKSLYRAIRNGSPTKRINDLVHNKGILTLQEHSSPERTDGKTQFPNVVSDISSIRFLLKYLTRFRLWYATATDVFNYTRVRSKAELVIDPSNEYFSIEVLTEDLSRVQFLTVELTGEFSNLNEVICSGNAIQTYKFKERVFLDVSKENLNKKIYLC